MPTTKPPAAPRTYLLKEAAALCGYRRVNTMREQHLADPESRESLGHDYDGQARVVLHADRVDALIARLRAERRSRGNWRIRNLRGATESTRTTPVPTRRRGRKS